MTYIAFLGGRTALAAVAVMSGAALIISCAGTLDDKDQYLTGGDDGPGGGSGQGNGATTGGTDPTTSGGDPTSTGGGGDPTTTGGDPTTTGGGGEPATTSTGAGGVTGCAEAQALVMSKCASSGCHDAMTKLAGLDLSTGWETRVARQAVDCGGNAMVLVPGDPEASLIYMKVTPAPPCDNRMPLGAPMPLMESEIKCLYDYIAALPK